MGEEGFEPPMFTTRDEIYSLGQHRQSLLFTHNLNHTIKNYSSPLQYKLPVGVEPTSLDYKSRPQPLRQGSI